MSELFANPSVKLENIASINDKDYQSVEKSYKYALHIRNFLLFLLLAIIIVFFHCFKVFELNINYFIAAYIFILILWIFSILLVNLGFHRKQYLLRKFDLIYKTGYLMQKVTIVPMNRIQHLEVRQSIWLRFFSLSKLVIYTAGGNTSDLSISGLKPDKATVLKEYISKAISDYE